MKFIPILFSTEMVQAILAGRKTQTRRVLKLSRYLSSITEKQPEVMTVKDLKLYDGNGELMGNLIMKYGKPGDVLWVRESFLINPIGQTPFLYKAGSNISKFLKWKPSIHMPKEAARLFLLIKQIRVERLRDIFHSDARAEGIDFVEGVRENFYYNYLTMDYGCNELFSFMTLWQKINGEKSWEENPWVWVIEFERIEKPENFLS